MAGDNPQAVLARSIGQAAERVLEGKLPPAWAGEQLVALIRHRGYLGHDWELPDAFQEFDHVMMDLECFPDGRMTTEEDIVAAARGVLAWVAPS
jgi:hypothetical protein